MTQKYNPGLLSIDQQFILATHISQTNKLSQLVF